MTTEVQNTPGGAMQHTVGIFTARVVQRLSDGQQLVSDSRRHRKGLPPFQVGRDGVSGYRRRLSPTPGCTSGRLAD